MISVSPCLCGLCRERLRASASELGSMKTPTGRQVNAKRAASLLKERNGKIDPRLGRTTIRRYILDDGSALVLAPNGTGHHWDSYDDLMKWVGMLEARAAEGRSALGDVLPLGHDFLNHIPRLVESLPRLLRLERSALDGTERSLDSTPVTWPRSFATRFERIGPDGEGRPEGRPLRVRVDGYVTQQFPCLRVSVSPWPVAGERRSPEIRTSGGSRAAPSGADTPPQGSMTASRTTR